MWVGSCDILECGRQFTASHFFFSSFRAFSRSAGSDDLPPDVLDSPNMSLVRSFTCPFTIPAIQIIIYTCSFLAIYECDRRLCLPVRSESLDMTAVVYDAGSPKRRMAAASSVFLCSLEGKQRVASSWTCGFFLDAFYTTPLVRQVSKLLGSLTVFFRTVSFGGGDEVPRINRSN